QRGTAEHVGPAGGVSRNTVPHWHREHRAETRAFLEPATDGSEKCHARSPSRRLGQCWHLAAAHPELAVLNPILVFEQATRRRTRRPRPVLVIDAAVTRAHEQA